MTELGVKGSSEMIRFDSTLIHDLKAPLASIDGYINLLTNGPFAVKEEKQRSYLEAALASNAAILYMFEILKFKQRMIDRESYEGLGGGDAGAILEKAATALRRGFRSKKSEVRVEAEKIALYKNAGLVEVAAAALLLSALNTSHSEAEVVLSAKESGERIEVALDAAGAAGPGPIDCFSVVGDLIKEMGGESFEKEDRLGFLLPTSIGERT